MCTFSTPLCSRQQRKGANQRAAWPLFCWCFQFIVARSQFFYLFELFMHFVEVRQNVGKRYCLSEHTLPSIMNECTKACSKPFCFCFLIPYKKGQHRNFAIGQQKCILPPGVRGNISQTARPASGLQGQIFRLLLDLVSTPGKGHWQTHRRDSEYMRPFHLVLNPSSDD